MAAGRLVVGFAVACAGDVNDDGFGDIIVGAPLFDSPQIDEGAAFVYLGSPSGIASGNATTAATATAVAPGGA